MRQYKRDDVDYETWYTPFMKQLAKNYTLLELSEKFYDTKKTAHRAGKSHLRAIERSSSMDGNSMTRAHARNVVAAVGDTAIAISGAIEIHELFPEHAKGSVA